MYMFICVALPNKSLKHKQFYFSFYSKVPIVASSHNIYKVCEYELICDATRLGHLPLLRKPSATCFNYAKCKTLHPCYTKPNIIASILFVHLALNYYKLYYHRMYSCVLLSSLGLSSVSSPGIISNCPLGWGGNVIPAPSSTCYIVYII